MFPGLDRYYTDPAQHVVTSHEELDDLLYTDRIDQIDHGLSKV